MSNEYEIKVEGAVHTFEGGATRIRKIKDDLILCH